MQYTIRNIPDFLTPPLRDVARREDKSLNEVAVAALVAGPVLAERERVKRDLSDIAGTWQEDPHSIARSKSSGNRRGDSGDDDAAWNAGTIGSMRVALEHNRYTDLSRATASLSVWLRPPIEIWLPFVVLGDFERASQPLTVERAMKPCCAGFC